MSNQAAGNGSARSSEGLLETFSPRELARLTALRARVRARLATGLLAADLAPQEEPELPERLRRGEAD